MRKYIAETPFLKYFRDEEDSLSMQSKRDKEVWDNHEVVEGSLYDDIKEGIVIKISPDFIYDYREIYKQIWDKEL